MITPEQLAKSGSEHGEQSALFLWAKMNEGHEPRLKFMFAIPNGGSRGDDAKSRKIRGSMLKMEGVKPGTVDIFLPIPVPTQFTAPTSKWYHGLFIEMKKPSEKLKKGPNGPGPWDYGGVKDDQKEFLDFAVDQGYKCAVCYSWIEAANEIKFYLTGSYLDGRTQTD